MTAVLSLLAVLLILGFLLSIAVMVLMARAILQPPRMNDGKAMYRLHRLSPGDLGLRFENESFNVRDARSGRSLHFAGWWIPSPRANGRCAILVHGYADAKVGAIAWAPLLHKIGWNILAIDLRAHGESDGRYSTGGYFERDDLTHMIDDLLVSRATETRQLVLFGISLGAAVVAAVGATRNDLAAVVLESPFPDYRRVVAAHFQLLGLPRGAILRGALWLAQNISGAKFDQVRSVDTIPRIQCPVLAILGQDDELLNPADITALKQALVKSRVLSIPQAAHLMGMHTDALGYSTELNNFLEEAIAARTPSATWNTTE